MIIIFGVEKCLLPIRREEAVVVVCSNPREHTFLLARENSDASFRVLKVMVPLVRQNSTHSVHQTFSLLFF